MHASPEQDAESARIGHYEVLRKIATGGMAELFLAKQVGMEGFEKVVAIKRILSHLAYDEEFIAMFRDEARIVAKLNHPNIVQIYDLGKSEDSYFIAMEYIPGRNMSSIAKKARALDRRLPPAYIARCVAQACEGLYYAHTRKDMDGQDLSIIHRDVSPQNIIVSFSGTVKLVDFGIAKAASKVAHTRAGVLKGKYAYMSPEQIRGETIDARSDLFSVGIVLYELLCGRRPFEKENSIQTLKSIVQDQHVPARELNPDIPEVLDAIIDRCLEKDRLQRFGSAQEVQLALEDMVSSSEERCNNITISNWLSDLFREELSRDNGGTVVFQGVGEVILPEVYGSDAKERAPTARPSIEAPSNALLDDDGRSDLIEEAPIGRDVDPAPEGGFTDDFTEHADVEAREVDEQHLEGPVDVRAYDDDATAFMAPPTGPAPEREEDEAFPAEEGSFSLAIDEASGEHELDGTPSWEASTLGLMEAPRSPDPRIESAPERGGSNPWAEDERSQSDSLGGALLHRLDSGADFDLADDGGDQTIAMPSLQGDEAESEGLARELAAAAGDAFGLDDATLAASDDDELEDEGFEGGDATIAMPSVSHHDEDEQDEGDRTLGAEELAKLFGEAEVAFSHEPTAGADTGPSELDDAVAFADATIAGHDESQADATLAGVALEDEEEDEVEVPFESDGPEPISALGEEHTVRGMDEEPSLPGPPPVVLDGYGDDRTLAGVTSDFAQGGLEVPESGAYDPLPEPEPEPPEFTPARPRPARGGRELGAIALERREVALGGDDSELELEPAFESPADDVLIDPDLDLDAPAPEGPNASTLESDRKARDEYSALVGGPSGDRVRAATAAQGPRAIGSTNVPPASLSLSQVLSHPMGAKSGAGPSSGAGPVSGAQFASGSRLQAIPRGQPSAVRASPSRSTSLIGRQIREVVRADGPPPVSAPIPDDRGPPGPGATPPGAFERAPQGPLAEPPPPYYGPPRRESGRLLTFAAMAAGVLGLAAATFFVLPDLRPIIPGLETLLAGRDPNLTIKTEPSGATVRVNGAVQGGRTPLTISGLTPGIEYQVELELQGHHTVTQEVRLPAERPLIWNVRLERAGEGAGGPN